MFLTNTNLLTPWSTAKSACVNRMQLLGVAKRGEM
jgi:hypothetical protein